MDILPIFILILSAPNPPNFFVLSNLQQNFFDLVRSLIFYGVSKYVKMSPFWFTAEFNRA